MNTTGKVLFYHEGEGNGIIMTAAKEKYAFNVAEWNDYDYLPHAGMEVSFQVRNGQAFGITSLSGESTFFEADAVEDPEAPSPEAEADVKIDHLNETAKVRFALPPVIRLSVNASKAINDYFHQIKEQILEQTQYRRIAGRIDFLRIRRFLFTTYNNLSELDPHFITDEIRQMHSDLMKMSRVYDDYRAKATFPDVAFEKIFLARQEEYVSVERDAATTFAELGQLRVGEETLSTLIKERQEVVDRTPRPSVRFDRIYDEFKELKGQYVDTVHNIATLEAHYHEAMALMKDFEQRYREEFFRSFNKVSVEYRKLILQILDAQAFQFDAMLWAQAKRSAVIKSFFKEAHIDGEYCSKTYLKYYLNTLDPDKISSDQRELFKLYQYLESLEKDVIVAMIGDIDDAMKLKAIFSDLSSEVLSEAFIDETKALKWAIENRANIIIIADELMHMSAKAFIKEFQRRVISHPKIIMISDDNIVQYKSLGVTRVLPVHFKPGMMEQAIREQLKKENT